MNCKFMDKCTYFEDAAGIGGALKQNIEKFCHNNGTGCAFYLLLDNLGADFLLPLSVDQTDIESAKKILENEKPCWTFKKCPEERKNICPAFINKKGKICWLERATLCQGKLQGNFMEKLDDLCGECDFYLYKKKSKK